MKKLFLLSVLLLASMLDALGCGTGGSVVKVGKPVLLALSDAQW